jgi:molybdopterin-guanine dinucleotide biosynthesis protein MobB
VRFPDDSLFHNINTMSDYDEARVTARASMSGAAPTGGHQPALVAIVGASHSAITALVETLSPELVKLGLRVATIAPQAHGLEIGRHGDDLWRDGRVGGLASAFAAPERLAFADSLGGETPLADIARTSLGDVDLVVAEGFRRTAPHRVELFSDGAGRDVPVQSPSEPLALVTDAEARHAHRFALGDTAGLARFIAARLDTLRAY